MEGSILDFKVETYFGVEETPKIALGIPINQDDETASENLSWTQARTRDGFLYERVNGLQLILTNETVYLGSVKYGLMDGKGTLFTLKD